MELAHAFSGEVDPNACRRRAVRRWVRLQGEIVRADDFTLVAREVVDLSEDGLRALVEDSIAIGERVVVSLRLPSTSTWIDREGVVVHVGGDGSIGVAFDAVERVERARIAGELRRLPPVVPRRASGTFARA